MEAKDVLAALVLLREASRELRESIEGKGPDDTTDTIQQMTRDLCVMSDTLEYIQERESKP